MKSANRLVLPAAVLGLPHVYGLPRGQRRARERQGPAHAPVRSGPAGGRNGLCPCGSGAKYKRCCGKAG